MDRDDQRALAGELRRVWAIEKAADQLAVEALYLDEFGLDIDRGIEPAGLAFGPAGHREGVRIDRVGVGRHLGRRNGQPDRAPRRNVDPAHGALGQPGHLAHRAGLRIEQAQLGNAGLVDGIGDEAAIVGNVEAFDVPLVLGAARGELAGLGIERAEPLEVAALVAGDPQGAVRRKAAAAIGDRLLVIADRGHRPAGKVQPVEIGLGDRDRIGHHHRAVAGGKPGHGPAAALDFLDQLVG